MDTEEKIRLGLQIVVAVVLWIWGFYTLALLATVVLVPWKPFYEASAWLVEPILKRRLPKSIETVEVVPEPTYAEVAAGLARLGHSDA